MNSKTIIAVIVIVVLLGGAFFFLKFKNKSQQPITSSSQTQQEQNQTQATVSETQASPAPSAEAIKKQVEVTLTATGFSPKEVTVDRGTKVIWMNKSGKEATVNSNPHPVHTDHPELNLGSFNDGETGNTLELFFNSPGTFNYHNHFNAVQGGTVIVK